MSTSARLVSSADAAARARAARMFLRSRRRRWRPSAYQLYATVICGAIAGALGHGLLERAISTQQHRGALRTYATGARELVRWIAPQGDEIVLPKTSSSVFISTNIHYILGNLGIKQLIIVGALTDQCVDSAVRDACDLGYLVTVPTDACATQSRVRHENSLANNSGYCRQISTQALLAEISALT